MAKSDEPVLAIYESPDHALRFKVHGGLHMIQDNGKPYFSLTCSGRDRGSEFGGASHDLILEHFPKLKPLADLHLSDIDGVPMHAEANGWYNLSGYFDGAGERYHVGNSERHFPITPPADKPWQNTEYRKPTKDECLQIWADHVRLPLVDAQIAADEIANMWNWPDMREAHKRFIVAQAPRWKAEAEACVKDLGLVIYGDHYEAAEV